MRIELTKSLLRDGAADEADVRQVKKALNRLGYYTPYEKVGITGIPDSAMFDAIEDFQGDNGIRTSGELRPGDATTEKMNEASEENSGYYVWTTVNDGRVRPAHVALEGEVR